MKKKTKSGRGRVRGSSRGSGRGLSRDPGRDPGRDHDSGSDHSGTERSGPSTFELLLAHELITTVSREIQIKKERK